MGWTIYCHTHKESGRRYIGLTRYTMMHRWNQHCAQSKSSHGYGHFRNAIRLYGKDAFAHRVLEKCETLESANEAEEAWINSFSTRFPEFGFNLARGGSHIPIIQTIDFKAKMSLISREVHSRPEVQAKLKGLHKGRIHGLEAREKNRLAQTGKNVSASHRLNTSAASKAAWSDPAIRTRIISSKFGRQHDQVVRDKIGRSLSSRPRPSIYLTRTCEKHGILAECDIYTGKKKSGDPYSRCRLCMREIDKTQKLRKKSGISAEVKGVKDGFFQCRTCGPVAPVDCLQCASESSAIGFVYRCKRCLSNAYYARKLECHRIRP